MARLDDFKDPPPIVFILGWNQWFAQRICAKRDLSPDPECRFGGAPTVHGNPVFTDEFSQEYSNDLERGGQMGDTYYRLLACEVNRRKLSRSDVKCP